MFISDGTVIILETLPEASAAAKVEQTAIRKKTKSIYFTTEPYVVKVRLRHRLKEIAVGDHIAVFVSDNMPVYQENGCQILNGYIAIEIKKGSGIHD